MNRPVQVYDGVYGTPTTLSYDHGTLTRLVDPKGQVYNDSVNALGWPTRQYSVADTTKSTALRYNRDGLVIGATNRRGQALTYTFDAAHRLLSQTGTNAVPDSFAYKDSAGGPVRVAWDSVARDSTFANAALILTKAVTLLAGHRFERDYFADSVGAMDSLLIKTDTADHIAFVSRKLHRNVFTQAVDVLTLGSAAIGFTADGDGKRTTVWLPTTPSVAVNYNFTTTDVLDSIGLGQATLNSTLGHGYGYDNTGRIARETNAGGTHGKELAYDGRSRLTGVTYVHYNTPWCTMNGEFGTQCPFPVTDSTLPISYDSLDNRTGTGISYTAGNRLASFGGSTYLYDDDGNVTAKHQSIFVATHFYWSADGLLDSTWDSLSNTHVGYRYDAGGQLVRKDKNSRPYRYFLWDRGQLLAELDSTGTKRVAEYVYDLGVDNPVALITGDTAVVKTRYFVQNGLGDVTAVLQDTSIAQQLTYDPWGVQEQVTGSLADTNRLAWKGMMWEGGVGYYVRARWYDPTIGRFLSEDPAGLAGGVNQYVFGGDDPVDLADPSGEDVVVKCPGWQHPNGSSDSVWTLCPVQTSAFWTSLDFVLASMPMSLLAFQGDPFGPGGGGGGETNSLVHNVVCSVLRWAFGPFTLSGGLGGDAAVLGGPGAGGGAFIGGGGVGAYGYGEGSIGLNASGGVEGALTVGRPEGWFAGGTGGVGPLSVKAQANLAPPASPADNPHLSGASVGFRFGPSAPGTAAIFGGATGAAYFVKCGP